MIASPVRDRAADEGERRKGQSRNLVGPQKRMLEKDACEDIAQHHQQLADQRGDDHRFGHRIDTAQQRPVRRLGQRLGRIGHDP